jgi:HTH-type transcriptional regulator, sugar sensing transcriptional regulator
MYKSESIPSGISLFFAYFYDLDIINAYSIYYISIMLIATLQQYGLTEREAKVYLAAVSLWSSPGSTIARHAKENRVTVYSILKELVKKGIFTTILRQWVTYFSPVHPKFLIADIEKKYQSLQTGLSEIEKIMNQSSATNSVVFFEWPEWVKKAYDDLLTSDGCIHSFLWTQTIEKDLLRYLYKEFLPRRIKKWISAKVLLCTHEMNEKYVSFDKKTLKESKIINKSGFSLTGEINIYAGNKVSFNTHSAGNAMATIITNKEIHDNMLNIFSLLWWKIS